MARNNNNKSSCSSGCSCCLLRNGSPKISKLKINIEPKMKSCKNFLKSSSRERERERRRGRRVEGVVPIETGSHATKSLARSSDFAQGQQQQEVCARGSPSLLRVKARTTCVSCLSLSLSPSVCNK